MTSTLRVTAHPANGLRAEAVVQDYSGSEIKSEEIVPLIFNTETTLHFWDGRQITFREVVDTKPTDKGESG